MNIAEIRKLVEIIKRNDLREFELNEGEFSIRITRGTDPVGTLVQPTQVPPNFIAQPPVSAPSGEAGVSVKPAENTAEADPGLELITSPMVGTFYRAPSPDSKPFVEEGDKVNADSVVCIIEAMKVMNEIQAEISGNIVEVMVRDGESVEFGQPLFKVKN